VVAALALTIAGSAYAHPPAAKVGHRVEHLVVPGSTAGESRHVTVHLWYPADDRAFARADDAVYTSRLHGEDLIPTLWDALSWSVSAELARDTDAIDRHGKRFPAIVFSHGSVNDPIDYAHTLERIAGEGFVVAAPYHVNNTQDDVRVDFINTRANALEPGLRLFDCLDGQPSPCSRANLARSMDDRVRDITAITDALRGWFGARVDARHVGVLGHSRGTVTALAAAGGSTTWGFEPQRRLTKRLKAVMGMAIGIQAVTFGADVADVEVPALLVAGGKDTNSAQSVSEQAFDAITSDDKLFVGLPLATHRSFDSTYCAQLQSAASAFDADHDGVVEASELTNQRPILDRHTVGLIAASAPNFISGKAVHYCARTFITQPVDIQRVVADTFNAEYACDATSCRIVPPVTGPAGVCVSADIPCTGLDTEEVKDGMAKLAAAFFRSALGRGADSRPNRWLSPAWLVEHVRMVGTAEAVCAPRLSVICAG
jgi:predicted dienelactone hydrolase